MSVCSLFKQDSENEYIQQIDFLFLKTSLVSENSLKYFRYSCLDATCL